MDSIEPEQARIAITGKASDHDARADRLESVARPFHLFALLLQHDAASVPPEWSQHFSTCLRHGTTVDSPAYWGPTTNFHQLTVEMGLLVLSLEMTREHFWEKLEPSTKCSVLDWLETARGVAMHWNNHLFFGIYILEFLQKEGRERMGDEVLKRRHWTEIESMYRQDGWFRDGVNDTADYYNAFAFHYYGLNWCLFYADASDPRRTRWMEWAHAFLTSYQYVYASDGSVPNFGRSQIYRFATLASFGPALALGCCPQPVPVVKHLSETHLDYFLQDSCFTPEGWFNIGWIEELPIIAESYSCTASCYWAAKGFSLLLLPPEHAFWQAQPASAAETYHDGEQQIPGVGLHLRRFGGDTEIINAGTAVSQMNLRFYAAKWSKFAYRASAGTVLPNPENLWPEDMALIAEFEDARFGRHLTYPTEFGPQHMRCAYTLGENRHDGMVSVETLIAWKGPWLYIEHKARASTPCRLRQGGFALGYQSADDITMSARETFPQGQVTSRDGRTSLLQCVRGYDRIEHIGSTTLADRKHTLFPFHSTPVAIHDASRTASTLACLVYFGPHGEQSQPWSIHSHDDGNAFTHPLYGTWKPA